MKRTLFFLSFYAATIVHSQDTIIKYNSEKVIAKIIGKMRKYFFFLVCLSFSVSALAGDTIRAKRKDEFHIRGGRYFTYNNLITRMDVVGTLSSTGDQKILQLLALSNKEKKREYWGLMAIPLGVFTVASAAAITMQGTMRRDNAAAMAIAGLAATITFPVIGGIHHKRRLKYDQLAMDRYNQEF